MCWYGLGHVLENHEQGSVNKEVGERQKVTKWMIRGAGNRRGSKETGYEEGGREIEE